MSVIVDEAGAGQHTRHFQRAAEEGRFVWWKVHGRPILTGSSTNMVIVWLEKYPRELERRSWKEIRCVFTVPSLSAAWHRTFKSRWIEYKRGSFRYLVISAGWQRRGQGIRTFTAGHVYIVGKVKLYDRTLSKGVPVKETIRLPRHAIYFYALLNVDNGSMHQPRQRDYLTFTKTVPPVPLTGFPLKFFAFMVVVLPKIGLKKDISGKKGEESRNCRVAGSG